ncbi:MAG: hypothetical protein U0031_03490 [Thermomicrobiales bacterium]
MECERFDRLTRVLGVIGTDRRSLAGLLGGLLLPVLPGVAAEASHGRGEHGPADDLAATKKKKKKKKCKPNPDTTTCAGKCGAVTNNCKKTVNCGSCACNPPCEACFTCQQSGNNPGACAPDTALEGNPCGKTGQVCQPGGVCACDSASCMNPSAICRQGECESCSADQECRDAGKGDLCCLGKCVHGNCCTSASCGNPQPVCIANVCTACTSHNQCGSHQICSDGSCLTCDVCATGCAFDSVQAAVTAANATATIIVCPGEYLNEKGRFEIRDVDPEVIVIGAGDGENANNNTILKNAETPKTVVYNDGGGKLTLQGLRITGGEGNQQGGGIYNNSNATLKLIDCTVVDNSADFFGGGIMTFGALTFSGANTVTGNDAEIGSGIYVGDGGSLQGIGAVTVSGNVPEQDQCFGCPSR